MTVSDWISLIGLVLMGIVIPTVGYFIKAVSQFQKDLAKVQQELALAKQRSNSRDNICEQHRQWLVSTGEELRSIGNNVIRLLERNKIIDVEHQGERLADGRHKGT